MTLCINGGTLTPHYCNFKACTESHIRPYLHTEPYDQPEITLFCNGSCYKGDTGNIASYAVVQWTNNEFHTVASGIKTNTLEARGNDTADKAAKMAGGYLPQMMQQPTDEITTKEPILPPLT